MTIEENIKYREEVIKQQFKEYLGYELNLENPQTFNEKLQWLKLYYHDPLMTKYADKYLVREYIKETVGEEYLIPLIGVWDRVEDIDFDKLPNQFVLKVNWGSGQNIIVNDKNKLNIEEAKNKLKNWIQPASNHYYYSYEWPYKNIEHKIIAEKYINDNIGNLTVYKIFCFDSNPYLFQVIINDKTANERINYYDLNWNRLILKQNFDNFNFDIQKPKYLNLMLKFCRILSKNFPYFIRIDFYESSDIIYFSEYTFYSDAGYAKFTPDYWDEKLGNLINLPKEKKVEYDFIDKDTLLNQVTNLEPIGHQCKILEYNLNCANDTIKTLNYINKRNEELKLNINWFSLLSILGIHLFAISNNSNYIRLTILGIKLTFKVNENSINQIAWWIPIKKLRDNFRVKFKRPDHELICIDYIYFYNNSKYKKLQPMLQYNNAA